MLNHTFFIVAREKDMGKAFARNPDSFYWSRLKELNAGVVDYTDRILYTGWEFVDKIEMDDYQHAKNVLAEYKAAMPSHTVLIHAKRIGE